MSDPFINLKDVWRAHPSGGDPHGRMRTGTSADGGHGQFILGYLCAIAFRLGMSPEEIHEHYAALRKELRAKHVNKFDYADHLHKIIEERIAKLPEN